MRQLGNVTTFIIGELARVFGLPREYVERLVAREAGKTQEEEWAFWQPKDEVECRLYYQASRANLFCNAKHKLLQSWYDAIPDKARILDFGGGAGALSFALVEKALWIDYYDISIIQREFVSNVAHHHCLPIRALKAWPPKSRYDVVLASDVFEHIQNYDEYLEEIAKRLWPGGKLFVVAPFGPAGSHLRDEHGFPDVCERLGLERLRDDVYEKRPE